MWWWFAFWRVVRLFYPNFSTEPMYKGFAPTNGCEKEEQALCVRRHARVGPGEVPGGDERLFLLSDQLRPHTRVHGDFYGEGRI
jgi:hypothetical protein